MAEQQGANIFIVDDHAMVRLGLRTLLETVDNVIVCGEADTIATALVGIKQCQPDLVIVDISLPDGSGLDLIKRLHAHSPQLPILVSSMHDEQLLASRALCAGAMGYVNKKASAEHLIEAVATLLNHHSYVSDIVRTQMSNGTLNKEAEQEDGEALVWNSALDGLTNRELEVFEQIGKGCSTQAIAEHLHLSIKTVETHRSHIKHKLGLASSLELIRHAVQWSLEGWDNTRF